MRSGVGYLGFVDNNDLDKCKRVFKGIKLDFEFGRGIGTCVPCSPSPLNFAGMCIDSDAKLSQEWISAS